MQGATGFRERGKIAGSTRRERSDCDQRDQNNSGHRFRVESWSTFELCSGRKRKNSQCVGASTARVPGDDVVLPLDARANLISKGREELDARSSRSAYKVST